MAEGGTREAVPGSSGGAAKPPPGVGELIVSGGSTVSRVIASLSTGSAPTVIPATSGGPASPSGDPAIWTKEPHLGQFAMVPTKAGLVTRRWAPQVEQEIANGSKGTKRAPSGVVKR